MPLTYEQKCFQWASGDYLSEALEPDFYDLETEDQFEVLEQMAWQPFEDYRGKDIYDFIYSLAYDIENKLYPIETEEPQ